MGKLWRVGRIELNELNERARHSGTGGLRKFQDSSSSKVNIVDIQRLGLGWVFEAECSYIGIHSCNGRRSRHRGKRRDFNAKIQIKIILKVDLGRGFDHLEPLDETGSIGSTGFVESLDLPSKVEGFLRIFLGVVRALTVDPETVLLVVVGKRETEKVQSVEPYQDCRWSWSQM